MTLNEQFYPILLVALTVAITIAGCSAEESSEPAENGVEHPEWSENANIYEVNIRQYTEEGTFDAFRRDHLERLDEMGVDILWIMPIHPIGEENRKGELGSYYSITDYKAVNPEFGDMEDFKALVEEAHERGMKVILDWVANHTAWDHVWTEEHPEWYETNEEGNFTPPVEDWSDVIQLDYENEEMRDAMADAMRFWVEEANIDGYRCDVAEMVPTDFWNRVRSDLDEIKPVFMLAEAEVPEHHEEAFDMSYAWEFHGLMNDIASGEKPLSAIDEQMEKEAENFGADDYRMMFTSNHDENSWNGTVEERMGENAENFAVLSATIHGMPLIYSGQEAGLDKRLEFFERDPISWDELPLEDFYTTLNNLKTNNEALWNGASGGQFTKVETDKEEEVYAYRRIKDDHEVFVMLNFSDEDQEVSMMNGAELADQTYTDVFSGDELIFDDEPISLDANGYLVLEI